MKIIQTKNVDEVFDNYPDFVKTKMGFLRELVIETTKEQGITQIEETLKWGEPSYLAKHGSTLRMDWKNKTPDQYAMYFKCTSKLVETFKEVYSDTFCYETTRAIVFQLDEKIPIPELKKCIATTLNYHKLKTKEQLGMVK